MSGIKVVPDPGNAGSSGPGSSGHGDGQGAGHGSGHEVHGDVGHVVSMRILIGVWLALMVLTWVTVAATYIDLGEFNFPLAMLIATVKAALVCLYFMHLRWDKPFNALVFLASLGFVALFIGFVMTDKSEYHEDEITGYAPLIEEEKR